MTKYAVSFALIAAIFAVSACSGDEVEADPRGSGVTGHSEAIIKTEEEVVESLENLWTDAGANPDLAECYASFFETEGLAEDVQDLTDLARVQSEFTDEQAAEFEACGPNTNPAA